MMKTLEVTEGSSVNIELQSTIPPALACGSAGSFSGTIEIQATLTKAKSEFR